VVRAAERALGYECGTAAVVMESLGASAVGCNCGLGPTQLVDVIRRMSEAVHIPIIANPNAGLPIVHDGKTTFPLDAEAFAAEMNGIASYATHLGGCCGTSPAHIQALVAASLPTADVTKNTDVQTYISSGRCALPIGREPVIVGSTLDASTACAFREALEEDDLYFAQDEALDQDDAGAQALMLNVGIPGIDEKTTLPKAVSTIQELCFLPLTIRTADPVALDAALRIYNGKPLVGCINDTAASMELLPIAAKYGCAVVVVPEDENGIPAGADARAAIIERLLTKAAKYGIARANIIADPLFTGDITVTLETIRLVRDRFSIGSILGAASDLHITPEQLQQAIDAEASAAVFDPNNEDYMTAYNR